MMARVVGSTIPSPARLGYGLPIVALPHHVQGHTVRPDVVGLGRTERAERLNAGREVSLDAGEDLGLRQTPK